MSMMLVVVEPLVLWDTHPRSGKNRFLDALAREGFSLGVWGMGTREQVVRKAAEAIPRRIPCEFVLSAEDCFPGESGEPSRELRAIWRDPTRPGWDRDNTVVLDLDMRASEWHPENTLVVPRSRPWDRALEEFVIPVLRDMRSLGCVPAVTQRLYGR